MARRPIGARAGQALAIVACCLVLVTGCTHAATPVQAPVDRGSASVQPTESATQTTSSADSGGAGGGGGGRVTDGGGGAGATDGGGSGANQAPGSPIDVPTVPEKHQSMDGLRDFIERKFVEACGGQDLCVKLEYGDGACFVGYDPAAQAARGSTVKVLTESQEDCDQANGLPGSGTATDGTTPAPTPSTDLPSSGTNGGSQGNGQPNGSSG